MSVTRAETKKTFGPSYGPSYTVTIPAGLRCVSRPADGDGRNAGKFWLDEFPRDIFPLGSMIRHDAEFYGVTMEADEVTV